MCDRRVPSLARLSGEPFEPVDIDDLGIDSQPVTGGGELDQTVGRAAIPQPPPKPRNLGLQRLSGALGWVIAVQAIDQPLGGDDTPGVESQEREQPAQLRTAEGDQAPVRTAGFDRPENGELHAADSGPDRKFR
ncbi:hypothetical protein H074_32759 [Amycolatopsis decaplanina DSM 44594]|uniref:Uncharacterized protein n=1 Tax=Amycolatopsis decaplanina DSM 44594 TaxID=1284240 RepID=M2YBX7_9PSEU|nr:hypothetical protein H074_32759 [Amycolatopsis decaplanina DSM 44594]